MKKRITVSAVIVVMLLTSYWTGFSLGKEKDKDDIYKQLDLFSEGLSVIEKKYVEDKPSKDLIYGAMTGLMSSLDSYSQFLTPDDYKELMVETEGKFGGLGIEITVKDHLLTVVSPIEDTPAWRAGLKSGDIIVKIDGELTRGISLNEAVKKLRGDPNTQVTVTILREGERKLKDITLTRDIIQIKDIKNGKVLEDSIGYIRITEFRENTAKDMDKVLADISKDKLKGMIIDVRNNPGGLLYSAIEVASRFLEDDKVVVSTASRQGKEATYKSLPADKKYIDVPIVVLINKGSASASEILAASLRDNKHAILLGETTFGKGSVQTIIPLSDGAALRLTTSKYYTPSGVSIHEKGIEPDVSTVKESDDAAAKNSEKTDEEVFKAVGKEGEFDYTKDSDIMRAVDLLKGISVLSDAGKKVDSTKVLEKETKTSK